MRPPVLMFSYAFAPSFGGVEAVAERVAAALSDHRGVVVVTHTLSDGENVSRRAYPVIRRPGLREAYRLARTASSHIHMHASIRYLLVSAVARRPTVVVLHNWLPHGPKRLLLRLLLARCSVYACSEYVSSRVPGVRARLANPVDFTPYSGRPSSDRSGIVFVGRLIDAKGPLVLVAALTNMIAAGHRVSAVLVGDGPARNAIMEAIAANDIGSNVSLLGRLSPEEIGRELRSAAVLVVPSVWEEPFGLVALEGLAAGCRVVVSDRGGLPEALGPVGIVCRFGENPADDLASCIKAALESGPLTASEQRRVHGHLRQFSSERATDAYLCAISSAEAIR